MKCKIKRIIYFLSIFVSFSYIFTSAYMQLTLYKFNPSNVKNNISILTSSKYEGRLTGTLGNFYAANFIKNSFADSKLKPYKNDYIESFTTDCPTCNNTTPNLSIKNSNGTILKEYKYGTDYKEDLINFKTSTADINSSCNIVSGMDYLIIIKGTHKYLFHVNNVNNFNFRSSFNASSKYDFCINITNSLYNDILDCLKNNYTLSINLPYTITSKYAYNVVSVIKGRYSYLPPLILSAHYDHLGRDYLGNSYNGALDNASGTSFLLELSKNISSMIKPNRDIIFVAFTGEEFGLIGSKEFVNQHYSNIKDSTSINFDMIGAPNTPITLMSGSYTKENPKQVNLLNKFKTICDKSNTSYNIEYKNSSDHASFSSSSIPSITLCHADTSKIHTLDDNVDYIDESSIESVYSLVQPIIYDLAYNKTYLYLYSFKITAFVSIIFILLILIKVFNIYKFKNRIINNKKHQRSIL